jgi:FSR family fosmidomycin resistance protein-like MFS transporter
MESRRSEETRQATNVKVIVSLTMIHFIGDAYFSFFQPLIPTFMEEFSLTLAQVGLLAGASRFLAFIVQPSVGYLSDHYRTRFFILGGPLLAIVFIPLIGIADGFAGLLSFICLGAVGSAMFHPAVAGMISTYAGSNFGLCMSVFNMGGTLAFGVGPVFITWFVERFGLGLSPVTMVFGLAVMIYLFLTVPIPEGEGLRSRGFIGSVQEALGDSWKSIVFIWIAMVLRSLVVQSFTTFLPVIYAGQDRSLISIGVLVALFTVAGALSGVLGGHIGDRVGFKPVFYVSYLLTPPTLIALISSSGNWVYLNAFLAGFCAMATLPLGIAMAQKLSPRGKSMVSSLMMGLAMGTGGMLTPLAGKLSDLFSIQTVLMCLAAIPFFSIGFIYKVEEKR